MRGHGDEIHLLARCSGGDFPRRVTGRQHAFRPKTALLEVLADVLEVLAIFAHLLRLAQLELVDVARRPPVGDVNEHDLRLAERRQAADVLHDRRVVARMLERYENALVHGRQASHARTTWNSSHVLSAAITNATT